MFVKHCLRDYMYDLLYMKCIFIAHPFIEFVMVLM